MTQVNTVALPQKTQDLLADWLQERQDLITAYANLIGLHGLESDNHEPFEERWQQFCELLIDYLSLGHFEVYQQLEAQLEAQTSNDPKAAMRSARVLALIQETTDRLLDINDQQEAWNQASHAEQKKRAGELKSALSEIGELVEERCSLEDYLLGCLKSRKQG